MGDVRGILPTFVTDAEALERARAAWKYAEAVDIEVSHAPGLTDADRASWRAEFDAQHAWYNDVINRSGVAVTLGSAAIADDAETFIKRSSAWSKRAREAGAPPTAPGAPEVPGGDDGKPSELGRTIRFVAVAVVAVAALSALRSVRS